MFDVSALKQFCDPDRKSISEPWSDGEFCYATNGHVAVRVPKPRGFAFPAWDALYHGELRRCFKRHELNADPLLPLPQGELPEHRSTKCDKCNGTGVVECRHCGQDTECKECDGEGEFAPDHIGVEIAPGIIVSSVYLGQLRSLPGVRMSMADNKAFELYFVFDGGIGVLMRRRPCPTDVKLIHPEAA